MYSDDRFGIIRCRFGRHRFQGEDRQQATLLPFGVKPLMQSHPQHHQRTITVLPPS
jgi:hypothetical protein